MQNADTTQIENKNPIPTDPFTQGLEEIRQQIHNGELEQAAKKLNEVQKQAPQDPRIPLLGMRLADKAGNLQGAIIAAQRAIKLEPTWHVALIELALLHARQQDHKLAMQNALKAVENAPDDVEVLKRAAAVAEINPEGNEHVINWLDKVLMYEPENEQMRLALAGQYLKLDNLEQAQNQYLQIRETNPENLPALAGLLKSETKLGNKEAAIKLAEELIEKTQSSPEALYLQSLAKGETPKEQPLHQIAQHFNAIANNYDKKIAQEQQYRIPEMVASRIAAMYPMRKFNLIDYGCGTGLLGAYLGRINGHIIGVDISGEMLKQAARHNIYSKFYQVNVNEGFANTPAYHYEIIACLDTAPYLGDMTQNIPNAYRILKPGGRFIFTCETAPEEGENLTYNEKTQRFAHKQSHIKTLCEAAGYDEIEIQPMPQLKLIGEEKIAGYLVIAHKSDFAPLAEQPETANAEENTSENQ